jgi:hypothetical protein
VTPPNYCPAHREANDIAHLWHPRTKLEELEQKVDDLTFCIDHLARRLNATIDYFAAALGAHEQETHRWINDKAAE